jgi:hypothetical protein
VVTFCQSVQVLLTPCASRTWTLVLALLAQNRLLDLELLLSNKESIGYIDSGDIVCEIVIQIEDFAYNFDKEGVLQSYSSYNSIYTFIATLLQLWETVNWLAELVAVCFRLGRQGVRAKPAHVSWLFNFPKCIWQVGGTLNEGTPAHF